MPNHSFIAEIAKWMFNFIMLVCTECVFQLPTITVQISQT